MRCVFDTNVLVSALLLPDSKPRKALDLAFAKGKVLLSFPTLAELNAVLTRRQFRRYLDEDDLRDFLAAFTRAVEWTDIDISLSACRDPNDNKFLELAISGTASHIISGDSDLLILNPFQNVQILSPRDFIAFASGLGSGR